MLHSLRKYLNGALTQMQCWALEISALVFKELSVHVEGTDNSGDCYVQDAFGSMRKEIEINTRGQQVAGKVLRLRT